MGGFFATALKEDCVFDLFFGTDYHSHLGTRRAGMAVYGKDEGFNRAIHNIENSPFRTKFDKDVKDMAGSMGIGCISDYEPQPLIVRSHHGTYAICTIGRINNHDELTEKIIDKGGSHFLELSGGTINSTELIASMINQKENIIEGIRYAQQAVDGSITIILMTPQCIYCARDRLGRLPLVIGKKPEGYCATLESFAFLNLGYEDHYELGPGEIAAMTSDGIRSLVSPGDQMKICTFLWTYFGYPSAQYEGISVERMRYNCGRSMARRDGLTKDDIDIVAGVPDSGIAHAVGYANESGVPFSRPLIKYTPTWPRSFMPTIQSKRDMIAKMKIISIQELIRGNRILLIDDSIVRGTQLKETAEYLREIGAEEIHARPACPPIMFGCRYLNFSRSNSDMELIARRVIRDLEGDVDRVVLDDYVNPDSDRYSSMLEQLRKKLGFDSLSYNRLDDMLDAVGIGHDKLCTYCWDGKTE